MTILALEFSSERRGVAVVRDGTVLSEVVHEGTRETPIFGLVDRVLGESGVSRDEIQRLAVGLGPGSYTGIRLSVAVTQGWQLGSDVEVVGVGSLDNLAVVATSLGPAMLAVDAQRNEWAVAEADKGRLVGPLRLMGVDGLRAQMAAGGVVAGPEVVAVLGGGATVYPSAAVLGRLAMDAVPVPAERLTPVYLREASFVKAPQGRDLTGIPPLQH
ncbi:MAG: tRNA (adenosine(37)-N6)-threonylcarbamoyltransferase complex dimerization subunit type 1 TsaB [Verrucomicrobiota bacterium]